MQIITAIIDTLKKEWAVVRGAPWSFVMMCLLIGAAQYWLFHERMNQQADMITLYKQRLDLGPYAKSKYGAMTNEQLRDAASGLSSRLQNWGMALMKAQGDYLTQFAASAAKAGKTTLTPAPDDPHWVALQIKASTRTKDFGEEPTAILSEMYSRLPSNFPHYSSELSGWMIYREIDRVARSLPVDK